MPEKIIQLDQGREIRLIVWCVHPWNMDTQNDGTFATGGSFYIRYVSMLNFWGGFYIF